MLDPSLPSKGFLPIGAQSVDYFDMPQSNLAGERTERLSISGGVANTSKASWKPMNHHPKLWSDLPTRPTSHSLVGSKTVINGAQHESSLFSSSLSEIFSRKCKLSFSFISIKLFLICFVWLVLPSIFSKGAFMDQIIYSFIDNYINWLFYHFTRMQKKLQTLFPKSEGFFNSMSNKFFPNSISYHVV